MRTLLRTWLAGLVALSLALPAFASTPTTNYSWAKPTVGADADNWGTLMNSDLDGIDSTVFGMCPKAGCTYTGPIIVMIGDATHAPLKLQAGTNLTSPVAGAMEWDGTNLFVTQTTGPTRKTLAYIDSVLTGSAAKLTTARNIAMSGDVVWTVSFDGSGNVTAAGTIQAGAVVTNDLAANAVTNAKMANMAAGTIKANTTGGSTTPADVTIASLQGATSSTFAAGNDARFSTAPQNSQSAAYGVIAADCGGTIYHPSADTTARTITFPANGTLSLPLGCKVDLINDCSAGTWTIAITSDTLVWFPAGSTGSRTETACGEATATKVGNTRWVIVGTGLSLLDAFPLWTPRLDVPRFGEPANDDAAALDQLAG